MVDPEGTAHVELAWDQASAGYDEYFAPRFAPYLGAAIGALGARTAMLPSGAILVPCVGPGRELLALARVFPEREILASDLSGEMVKRARDRVAHCANVSVERADATALLAPSGGAAALISVFGLQLLPDPAAALGSWLGLLREGGQAVVVYWPRIAEDAGPFMSMRRRLREAGVPDGDWEGEIARHAQAAGGRLLADVPLCFEIQHDSAQAVWEALTLLGPLRGLALSRGKGALAELGERFIAELPPGRISHTPEARLLIFERS